MNHGDKRAQRNFRSCQLASLDALSSRSTPQPALVPFEWFDLKPPLPEEKPDKAALAPRSVLVLYLEDQVYRIRPLQRIDAIFRQIVGSNPVSDLPLDDTGVVARDVTRGPGLHLVVLGPAVTATLSAMADELSGSSHGAKLLPVSIYSPWATIPEGDLAGLRGTLSEPGSNVALHRTIGGDDRLAQALRQEFTARQVPILARQDPSDEPIDTSQPCRDVVVLIAELDTDYAENALRALATRNQQSCIRTFRYLRGIDGTPAKSSDDAAAAQEPSNAGGAMADAISTSASASSRSTWTAFGTPQIDYLARLSAQIDGLQQRARAQGARARAGAGGDTEKQMQMLIDRIRDTTDGVYSPFLEQPLLRSLLLPIGGVGSLQILDLLSKL